MFGLGTQEMLILLIIGVLLFGRKLPEIGKSLGKGIVEFKKGLHGLEDELDGAANGRFEPPAAPPPRPPQRVAASAPKFQEPPGQGPEGPVV